MSLSYLQNLVADHIADKMIVTRVSCPSPAQLREKHSIPGEYIAMRTEYGKRHHWPLDESGVDVDVYDYNPNTCYFLVHELSRLAPRLSAGLRLTKVNDFDESLSLSMWAHAVDKPHIVAELIENKNDIAHLKQAAHGGNLWDLTRLVTYMSLQAERTPKMKRATYVALLLLLGAALKHTGDDAIWIFTTNIEMKRFLDKLGLQYTLLATGRISYSDAGASYLGWISPKEAHAQLLHNPQPVIAHLAAQAYNLHVHHI